MRLVTSISILLLVSANVQGQVVNTLSADNSNMYVYAVDSVIKILSQTTHITHVELVSDRSIVTNMPDSIEGIPLDKMSSGDASKTKIRENRARLLVGAVEIIKDQCKIRILAWGRSGRLGDGAYLFRYQYNPGTMTFELKDIRRGIEL